MYNPLVYVQVQYDGSIGGEGTAPDLLTAVVERLLATPAVTGLLGDTANVFYELADTDTPPPFILVEGYTEVVPGESLDDSTIPLNIWIYSNSDLDTARTIGSVVKNTLDTPTINPNATMTTPLSFTAGTVIGVMRGNSAPLRKPGLGIGGKIVWCEQIQYDFWVSPTL